MKRKVALLLGVIIFLGFGFFLYSFLHPFFVEEDAKSELLNFQRVVFIGDSADELRRKFNEKKYRHLSLEGNPSYWICETPFQLGAKNWIMFIDLREEKVRKVRIRTADNHEALPRGAPKDIP